MRLKHVDSTILTPVLANGDLVEPNVTGVTRRLMFALLLAAALVAVVAADPFPVATYADLCKVGTNTDGWFMNASYVQTADIACPEEENFPRIGLYPGHTFTGTYDGNGYEIQNLKLEYSDFDTGMFVCTGSTTVLQNITLSNVDVDVDTYRVGALVGTANGGTYLDCHVTGVVYGSGDAGGLIGKLEGGVVESCSFSGSIQGGYDIGGLVGTHNGGELRKCFTTGSVSATNEHGGGLVGQSYSNISECVSSSEVTGRMHNGGLIGYKGGAGTVTACSASGNVTGTFYATGGLIGDANGGSIVDSYASGDVSNTGDTTGGLIGVLEGGSVSACYASGSASGVWRTGGLIGRAAGGGVSDSYASGPVTATSEPYFVGGLIGGLDSASIHTSYAVGLVSSPGASAEALERVGGFVGYGNGNTEYCFWDTETSGQTASAAGTGKTTAELQTLATFASWNIATPVSYNGEIWYIVPGEDYPRLAWEGVPEPPPPPVASFTGTPTSGIVPLAVQFTDTSTNAPTTWYWAFGDGTTSRATNPSHTYTAPGTYTVSLTATNSGGTDTETAYITVYDLISASFTGSPRSGSIPLTVQFTDTSAGSPTSWLWVFGDGGTSIEQHPTHIYRDRGAYTVSLAASNVYTGSEHTETKSRYIVVYDGLEYVAVPILDFVLVLINILLIGVAVATIYRYLRGSGLVPGNRGGGGY